jgi:hypothetical protein
VVVGNLPAVSSASRWVLSLVSCPAFSLGLNVPPGGEPEGAPDGAPEGAPPGAPSEADGVDPVATVLVVAAPLEAALNTLAPTAPPASSEAAIAAVMMLLRMGFMVILFLVIDFLVRRG